MFFERGTGSSRSKFEKAAELVMLNLKQVGRNPGLKNLPQKHQYKSMSREKKETVFSTTII